MCTSLRAEWKSVDVHQLGGGKLTYIHYRAVWPKYTNLYDGRDQLVYASLVGECVT